MFGTVLTVAATLMQLYVFWRAASIPAIRLRLGRKAITGFGAAMWLFFVAVRLMGHGRGGAFAGWLEIFALGWLVCLFLTSICLLLVDVGTLFGLLFRRHSPTLRTSALAVGAALSLLALVQGTRAPVVEEFEVRLRGLPQTLDGTVIVGLSDLHLGDVLGEEWLGELVRQVEAEKPDSLVLLGDIFEGHGEPQTKLLAMLGSIPAKLGVWAVSGNHEFHGGNGNGALADGSGVTVLRNRWAEIAPGLVLAGLEDAYNGGRAAQGSAAVAKALAGRPQGAVILLNHYPTHAEAAASGGAGLMLSGHTHGGQVWPFSYLAATRFPLLDGMYDVAGMKVIVSRGAGTWGPRMRLWKQAQILKITLRAADQ